MREVLAVGAVHGGERHPGNPRPDEPRPELLLAGETAKSRLGGKPGEDRHPVPRLLPVHHDLVAEIVERGRRELLLAHLEFLEADDVGLPRFEPDAHVVEARTQPVHVSKLRCAWANPGESAPRTDEAGGARPGGRGASCPLGSPRAGSPRSQKGVPKEVLPGMPHRKPDSNGKKDGASRSLARERAAPASEPFPMTHEPEGGRMIPT